MKKILIFISFFGMVHNAFGQIDSFNNIETLILPNDTCCESRTKPTEGNIQYYVLNYTDTVYVSNFSIIYDCISPLTKLINNNKRCQRLSFKKLITGKYYEHRINQDSSTHTFNGKLKNGYLNEGVIIDYYYNGIVKTTGQYKNGWQIGIWTNYFRNGKIESIWRYIEGAEYPVVDWEYNENGKLIEFNDEQKEIEKRLRKNNH